MSSGSNFSNSARPAGRPRRENERRILAAAEEAFARHGYGGTKMQQIAEQAGISKASLHYYFGDKRTLYRRVIADIFAVWRKAAECFEDSDSPSEALALYISTKMELSRRRPFGSKLWATEIIGGGAMMDADIKRVLKQWTESRAAIIRRWIRRGQIAKTEPLTLLYLIWSATQHYADFNHQIQVLNRGRPLSAEQFESHKKHLIAVILRGVQAA